MDSLFGLLAPPLICKQFRKQTTRANSIRILFTELPYLLLESCIQQFLGFSPLVHFPEDLRQIHLIVESRCTVFE